MTRNTHQIKPFFAASLLSHALLALVVTTCAVQGSRSVKPPKMLIVDLSQISLPDTRQTVAKQAASPGPGKTEIRAIKAAITAPQQPLAQIRSQPTTEPVVAKTETTVLQKSTVALTSEAASAPLRPATPPGNQGAGSNNQATAAVVATVGGSTASDVQFGSSTGPAFHERSLPSYPALARKFGKEGKVVLRLSIDEKGVMTGVEVITDPGYGFANAAIEALKKSSFVPARVAGRAVAVKAILPIRFSLQGVN